MKHPRTTHMSIWQALVFSVSASILFLPSSVAFMQWSPTPVSRDYERDLRQTYFVAFKPESSLVSLGATGSDKKRKKRRRKNQPPGSSLPDQVKTSQGKVEFIDETEEAIDDDVEAVSEEEIYQIQDVAKFEFDKDSATSLGKCF